MLKRRDFARLLLASAVTSRIAGASQRPAVSHRLPDIIVVGAGSFGAWTAHAMRSEGHSVTLVDAYEKEGRGGLMLFLIDEARWTNQRSELVRISQRTSIYR